MHMTSRQPYVLNAVTVRVTEESVRNPPSNRATMVMIDDRISGTGNSPVVTYAMLLATFLRLLTLLIRALRDRPAATTSIPGTGSRMFRDERSRGATAGKKQTRVGTRGW